MRLFKSLAFGIDPPKKVHRLALTEMGARFMLPTAPSVGRIELNNLLSQILQKLSLNPCQRLLRRTLLRGTHKPPALASPRRASNVLCAYGKPDAAAARGC